MKFVGEYDNGSAKSAGRTEYIWLPTESGMPTPVGLYRGGQFYALHTDHLGAPRLMTNEANKSVWQWPYSAFGSNKPTGVLKATANPRAAITNKPVLLTATGAPEMNLGFPGQMRDVETGAFYNALRDAYDANTGRYRQADPIGLEGGLSRFGYANQNPLMNIDPDGKLFFIPAAVWWGAAAVGATAWDAYMSTPEGRQAAADLGETISDICIPDDPDPCKGIRKQLEKHEKKLNDYLNDYLNDPLSQDNRGILTNALLGNDGMQASRVYESRTKELRRQIEGWKRELKKCEEKNGK